MDDKRDNFSWVRKLGFPSSGGTESNLLNKGIIGLLWDDSSKLLHHPKDVMETRKNVLLYKLKHKLEDPSLQYLKNINQLKIDRINLNDRIKISEEKYKDQEFSTIEKEKELRLVKQNKKAPELKTGLLKMKAEQINEILKDSETMLNICSHLKPTTNKDVSQNVIRECLGLMSHLRSGTNRKQIINEISKILGSIHIPTLWSLLLENQSQDMEALIKLGKREMSRCRNTIGEDIDIGLARACGEQIKLISMQLLEIAKTSYNEKILMDCIETIEMTEPNVNEWLEFTLEVRMLEVEQNSLQNEANQILNSTLDQDTSESKLAELSSNLDALGLEKNKMIEDVQKSLGYLKSIRSLLTETREKQLVRLQTISILHSDNQEAHFYQWQEIDLSAELQIFYRDLDMDALRQITLKRDLVEQRHLKDSFNEAWTLLAGKSSSKFPNRYSRLKVPFYYLWECYKALTINALYKRVENPAPIEFLDECQEWDPTRLETIIKSNLELLHFVGATCKKSQTHINEFEHIFDMWTHQSVESALEVLDEITVEGATLKEWQQRFSVTMYMLKQSSKVTLSFQPYSFEDR